LLSCPFQMPWQRGVVPACAAAALAACVFAALRRRRRCGGGGRAEAEAERDLQTAGGGRSHVVCADGGGAAASGPAAPEVPAKPRRDKGSERLEWWQRLNEVKPELTLPELQDGGAEALELAGEAVPAAYLAAVQEAMKRLKKGKDWVVRDSDYGTAPTHAAVKAKVNAALVSTMTEVLGPTLPEQLAQDPRRVLLLLDTPQYGTLRGIVASYPRLGCCQQVVIPQADLRHYFEMVRGGEFYPGVRAQRLDHWLCANAAVGLRCLASFLDFECRLVGALSARICPAADVMRFFRLGYPAEPVSVLALTVGLEAPAERPEEVDDFVRWEAALNGYSAELRQAWRYRLVTLLYVIRRVPGGPRAAAAALSGGGGGASATPLERVPPATPTLAMGEVT